MTHIYKKRRTTIEAFCKEVKENGYDKLIENTSLNPDDLEKNLAKYYATDTKPSAKEEGLKPENTKTRRTKRKISNLLHPFSDKIINLSDDSFEFDVQTTELNPSYYAPPKIDKIVS
jgi:hypothetical protein